MFPEPARNWHDQIHRRILHNDATAFAYLRMAARYDLMSAIDKEQRLHQRLTSLEELADEPHTPDDEDQAPQVALDDLLQRHTGWSFAEIIQALQIHLDRSEGRRPVWRLFPRRFRSCLQPIYIMGLGEVIEVIHLG